MNMSSLPSPPFLTGRMLVATPAMEDAQFRQSIVLLCDHDEEHAMGLILNKPMGRLTLPKLLDQIGIERSIRAPLLPVMDGGPCQRDRGFVIHSDDWECEDSTIHVANGLRLTATRDVLTALTGPMPPARVLMALGFSGWGPGQLEAEIRANAWLVCDADPDRVFDLQATQTAWQRTLEGLGIAPMHLSPQSGRA